MSIASPFRILALLSLLAWAGGVSAQCAPGGSPLTDPRVVQAVVGQPIVVRVRAEACAVYTEPATNLVGNVLEFGIGADRNVTACTVERDVDFTIPALPAGSYVLRFAPVPPISLICYPTEDVPFGVVPAFAASVPTLGAWAGVLFVVFLLLAGLRALRTMRA